MQNNMSDINVEPEDHAIGNSESNQLKKQTKAQKI